MANKDQDDSIAFVYRRKPKPKRNVWSAGKTFKWLLIAAGTVTGIKFIVRQFK